MTVSAIGNKHRHKNVSYDYTSNERSKCVEKCSKNSCATLLVKIIEKYLRRRSSCSSKLIVLKNFANFTGTYVTVSF